MIFNNNICIQNKVTCSLLYKAITFIKYNKMIMIHKDAYKMK